MDAGPTYLLIMTIAVLGVLGSFVVFLNSDNEHVIAIAADILAVCGLAYGISYAREKGKSNGTDTD